MLLIVALLDGLLVYQVYQSIVQCSVSCKLLSFEDLILCLH